MYHPLLSLAMTFYSVALLLSLAVTSVPVSNRGRWRILGAWVFNALAGFGFAWFSRISLIVF